MALVGGCRSKPESAAHDLFLWPDAALSLVVLTPLPPHRRPKQVLLKALVVLPSVWRHQLRLRLRFYLRGIFCYRLMRESATIAWNGGLSRARYGRMERFVSPAVGANAVATNAVSNQLIIATLSLAVAAVAKLASDIVPFDALFRNGQ